MSTNTPSKPKIQILPFHPLADLFPLMHGDEFDELVGDIERRGQRFDITIFEGQIIDGRNRALACQKAGKEPRYVQFEGKAEDVPRFIVSANIHRRHLRPDQRRDLIKKVLKLEPEQSNRAVAAMVKVDDKTVATVRAEMEATAEIPQLKARRGKDGKTRSRPNRSKPASAPKLAAIPKPDAEQKWPGLAASLPTPDEELDLLREFARFVIGRASRCHFKSEDEPEWWLLRERTKAVLRQRASPAPSHQEFVAKTNGAADHD
jgi:hypothetical protein